MKNITKLYELLNRIRLLGVVHQGHYQDEDGVLQEVTEDAVPISKLVELQRELLPLPLKEFHYPHTGKSVQVYEDVAGINYVIQYFIKQLNHKFEYKISCPINLTQNGLIGVCDAHVRRFKAYVNKELQEKFPSHYENHKLNTP